MVLLKFWTLHFWLHHIMIIWAHTAQNFKHSIWLDGQKPTRSYSIMIDRNLLQSTSLSSLKNALCCVLWWKVETVCRCTRPMQWYDSLYKKVHTLNGEKLKRVITCQKSTLYKFLKKISGSGQNFCLLLCFSTR